MIKKENLSDNKEIEKIKIDFKEIEKDCSKNLLYSKKSAKEIKQLTEDLSEKAKKIIEKYLSDDEQYIFVTLESINTKWMDINKIKQIVLKERIWMKICSKKLLKIWLKKVIFKKVSL